MSWNQIVGIILMSLGLIFIIAGMFGMFRYGRLGTRLLLATKVDTVGLLTVLGGACFYSGFSTHSLKIIMIMIFALITNPIITHAITHSANFSEYPLTGKEPEDD